MDRRVPLLLFLLFILPTFSTTTEGIAGSRGISDIRLELNNQTYSNNSTVLPNYISIVDAHLDLQPQTLDTIRRVYADEADKITVWAGIGNMSEEIANHFPGNSPKEIILNTSGDYRYVQEFNNSEYEMCKANDHQEVSTSAFGGFGALYPFQLIRMNLSNLISPNQVQFKWQGSVTNSLMPNDVYLAGYIWNASKNDWNEFWAFNYFDWNDSSKEPHRTDLTVRFTDMAGNLFNNTCHILIVAGTAAVWDISTIGTDFFSFDIYHNPKHLPTDLTVELCSQKILETDNITSTDVIEFGNNSLIPILNTYMATVNESIVIIPLNITVRGSGRIDLIRFFIQYYYLPPVLYLNGSSPFYTQQLINLKASWNYSVAAKYLFDLGDGTNSSWTNNSTVGHMFLDDGNYSLRCKIIDSDGIESMWSEERRIEILNQAPRAVFSLPRNEVQSRTKITLNGQGSYDNDGTIMYYHWYFGDGTYGNGSAITHIYNSPGRYNVTLLVVDDDGAENRITKQIIVRPEKSQNIWTTISVPFIILLIATIIIIYSSMKFRKGLSRTR